MNYLIGEHLHEGIQGLGFCPVTLLSTRSLESFTYSQKTWDACMEDVHLLLNYLGLWVTHISSDHISLVRTIRWFQLDAKKAGNYGSWLGTCTETTLFNARASLNLCWTVSCLSHIWGLCEGRRLSSLGPAPSIIPDTDVQSSSLASSVHLILENLATQRKRGREASEQNLWFCLPIPGNGQTARRRVCQLWVVGHPLLVACPYKWIFVCKHSHGFIHLPVVMSAFLLQWQTCWVFVIATAKPTYLPSVPLQKNFANSCSRERVEKIDLNLLPFC